MTVKVANENIAPGCPICGAAVADKFKPFCSKRCSDVDLHRWLGGVYRVESEETEDFDAQKDRE